MSRVLLSHHRQSYLEFCKLTFLQNSCKHANLSVYDFKLGRVTEVIGNTPESEPEDSFVQGLVLPDGNASEGNDINPELVSP